MKKKIEILIVDDSRIFRSALEKSLENESDIAVIGSVFNGSKAIEFIKNQRPDIVTLDLEMPGPDGIETLKAIQRINASSPEIRPIGVIMLSAFTEDGADITIQALEAGAFDFVPKPFAKGKGTDDGLRYIRRKLPGKIRQYANRETLPVARRPAPLTRRASLSSHPSSILIGGSTGGPNALSKILPAMCEHTDLPIFIAQHMPEKFTASMAKSLDKKCHHTVKEAENRELVQPGYVYIAPGGKHMLLRHLDQGISLVISKSPPEEGCRPSVNILFRSAAAVYGGDTIAVVLTGMGTDGTKGAEALKRAGAGVIAQDEATSTVWGMPRSAVNSGYVDKVVPLPGIPGAVMSCFRKGIKSRGIISE